jgi:hypothetical protein
MNLLNQLNNRVMSVYINGNTSAGRRLERILDYGVRQISLGSRREKQPVDVKTYYLLEDGKMVTLRQWYVLNKPNYIVSGSLHGCKGHAERNNIICK